MSKSRVLEFLKSTGALGTGSISVFAITSAINIFEHAFHPVATKIVILTSVAGFLWGAFLAWNKERDGLEELEEKAARPKIIFEASSVPDTAWHQFEESVRQSAPLFTLTNVGGGVAEFVQVQPIQSKHNQNRVWIEFHQIIFLDTVKREAHPDFELFVGGTTHGKKALENLRYVFFHMDADSQNAKIVTYPITVTYRWNNDILEDKFILMWDAVSNTLKTSPFTG